MKLCTECHTNPAEVPDRMRTPGRPINRICRACHRARLNNDLSQIVMAVVQHESDNS